MSNKIKIPELSNFPERIQDIDQAKEMAYAEKPSRDLAAEKMEEVAGLEGSRNPVKILGKYMLKREVDYLEAEAVNSGEEAEKGIDLIRQSKESLPAQTFLSKVINRAKSRPEFKQVAADLTQFKEANPAVAYGMQQENRNGLTRFIESVSIGLARTDRSKERFTVAGSVLPVPHNPLRAATEDGYMEGKDSKNNLSSQTKAVYGLLGLQQEPPEVRSMGAFGGSKVEVDTLFLNKEDGQTWSRREESPNVRLDVSVYSGLEGGSSEAYYVPGHMDIVVRTRKGA